MKNRSGEKIKLTSIDELLGVVNEESAMEIEIDKIKSFAGHPFKVIDDEKMQNLIESISESGVLTPVLIRPDQNDGYEMISGHRRMHAAQKAGLITIPAIVREMTDDEAVIAMVDANIQREELLPSEKAFAYKMKMEAMKRQGARIDLTCVQNDHKLGKKSREILGEQIGISSAQIQRYIRLTELIPDLLELVDKKRLNFTIAVDISYIPQDVQKWIYEYICDNGFIKPNQIAALKNYLGQGPVTQSLMISILNSHIQVKAPARKVTLNEKKLTKYFSKNYTSEDMEKVIESLLEKWKQEQEEV
ncbi:ParB/RepB/Spo0J family partition protein [Blautia sp. HCP28S3_G10]|uniref:ParB/RepB/Spo0J family partition protein n=1 Tax=Blautia sp. HCP28S3_G10 TaxID=3438908 RepID=UPI003F899574